VHWGGGTPNLLSVERFRAIVARLKERFDFSNCVRHAMEMDPRLVTAEQAKALAAAGVNRASLGAQDFDGDVQRAIGREQPYEVVADAMSALRAAGIEAISLDLMYGLPGQTLESVRDTARRALELNPSRLSVFGYAHVPWFKTRQRLIDETRLPDVSARFDLAEAIRECVEEAGYVAIGYDHYARPDDSIAVAARDGGLSRNFQGFVESSCDALIGLGPSSISTLPQGYAQNESNVTVWRRMIADKGLATRRGRALTGEDRRRREMIMNLLCSFSLDLGAYGGRSAFAREVEALDELEAAGLARVLGDVIFIPEAARPFARLAAQAFDLYAGAGGKHSRAV
jgi:oxygen-independent coproporphyrinogen-3 oxidase